MLLLYVSCYMYYGDMDIYIKICSFFYQKFLSNFYICFLCFVMLQKKIERIKYIEEIDCFINYC